MGQIIFNGFQLLADIPVNIWPWLLLISTPLLIFSAKPHHSVRWRFGRIFLAVAAGYMLINLTLHTHRALDWKKFEKCQSENPVFGENIHPNCEGMINIADGASNVFCLILGWIPGVAYAGWWELAWRRFYRTKMINLRKGLGDDLFSNLVITLSYYITLLIIVMATVCIVFYIKENH